MSSEFIQGSATPNTHLDILTSPSFSDNVPACQEDRGRMLWGAYILAHCSGN